MPQLFPRAANAWIRLALASGVGLPALAVGVLWALPRSPYITGQNVAVQQPIPFSHQHHVADAGIDCRYCHSSVEVAPFAGIPPTQICMNCHRYLWNEAAMLAPVRNSWRTEQPLRWTRVHDLPDHVYFDHSIHIHKGIGCYSCHGRIGTMPLVRQVQPLTMQWCLECHRQPIDHVRPRELVFDPRPLAELTEMPAYGQAVRELLGATPPTSGIPSDHPGDHPSETAEPSGPASAASLRPLRAALAERYGVRRRTDCYTCHR